VTQNPTAEWLARQITEAFPWGTAPKYLIRDNDRAFGGAFKVRVRAMGIRDRPTSFRSPWQNGYAERLTGSVRRECTDHLIAFNAEHLRRILAKYAISLMIADKGHLHCNWPADSVRRRRHLYDGYAAQEAELKCRSMTLLRLGLPLSR
jgi:Integrase core domain